MSSHRIGSRGAEAHARRAGLRIGEEFWIYWDCRVTPQENNPNDYDALVLEFHGDIVVAMKISDGNLIRRALADSGPVTTRWQSGVDP